MRLLVLGFYLLLVTPGFAEVKDQIVGTWKLVSVMYEDQQSKELTPVLEKTRKARRSPRRTGAGLLWLQRKAARFRRPMKSGRRHSAQ
jgi:hypothetical protein